MTLVEKISYLCEKKGVTRNKFEVESRVGRGQSARWDKNKPSYDKLQLAADYFGVSVSYLLTDEQKETPAAQSDGLEKDRAIWSEAWENASPEQRQLALSILKLQAPPPSN